MWFKIRPQEPLILGEARADSQFLTSQTYVPARVVRGAWAEWLLQQGLNDDQILAAAGGLRLGNFFPSADWCHVDYALPLPMSAVSCKRKGGFTGEPAPKHRGHGVVDMLLPVLAYRLLERVGARFPIPFALVCAECSDRMEPFGGFYAVYRVGDDRPYVQFRPRYHAQTKVALSRFRRASAEQMLYTASALSPHVEKPDREGGRSPVVFLGRTRGEPDAVDDLKKALEHTPLGALHTRGYGKVIVEDADAGLPDLASRLQTFNEGLTSLWQDLRRLATNACELPQKPEDTFLSVDLLAPGVFRENCLPTLVPSLIIGNQRLDPIFWITRPDMASGWSTAWGLPKPTNLAARMGSVYVFRWRGQREELLPALESLETQGIGERRDEGFGECLICHPFHQEVRER